MRPISLLTFTASLRRHRRALLRAAAGEQAEHRRDELVEREDRRGREAGQHDDGAPAGGGQADRLARLERDAVGDDAGIVELGDDAIRHVARALARAAGEQHDVGERQRSPQPRAQRAGVVGRDAEPPRLAAELPHRVGEDLRVRVVDAAPAASARPAR